MSFGDRRMNEISEESIERSKYRIAMNIMAFGAVPADDIAKATGLSVEMGNEMGRLRRAEQMRADKSCRKLSVFRRCFCFPLYLCFI